MEAPTNTSSPIKTPELVDLTQSSGGSEGSTHTVRIKKPETDNRKSENTEHSEGIRSKRKIIPVVKYGAIHYSNR